MTSGGVCKELHRFDSPRDILIHGIFSPTVIGFDHRYHFFFISALTKVFSFNWEKYGQVTIDSLEINCGPPLRLVFASLCFLF